MLATFPIATSGLAAARLRMDVAANNIANLATADFQRQTVATASQPGGGVSAQVVGGNGGADLVEDIVELKLASYAFRANLLSLQHAERTLGSLLDARG
jgi:flagellar basal body rod protein FlgC